MRPHPKNWTREQIRAARKASLSPVLERRGCTLRHTGAGNFVPTEYPGIIVKDCYWREPEQERSGNTIDFLVDVIGTSFAQAMEEIMQIPNTQ
jgi:hypothetical protein